MRTETTTLSLGKVHAARGWVVVLWRKPHCSLQLWKNAATTTVTAVATNPPTVLVPSSALSAPVVEVQHGVILHVVRWHSACHIDDNSLSPRKRDKQLYKELLLGKVHVAWGRVVLLRRKPRRGYTRSYLSGMLHSCTARSPVSASLKLSLICPM